MSNLEDTVKKIANSPRKLRAVRTAIPYLCKEAAGKNPKGVLDKLYGDKNKHKILTDLTTQMLGASLMAGGAMAISPVRDKLENSSREAGKLEAQNKFKYDQVKRLEPHHQNVFNKVIKDEVVSKADKNLMSSAYQTMKHFAPNLAADENAALSFLREHAIYGTGPSYASLKNLADAEHAIASSGGIFPE